MWAWWALMDMDSTMGEGMDSWYYFKLDQEVQCYTMLPKHHHPAEGGQAAAGSRARKGLFLKKLVRRYQDVACIAFFTYSHAPHNW